LFLNANQHDIFNYFDLRNVSNKSSNVGKADKNELFLTLLPIHSDESICE
jgi:hypothetical protein